MEDGSERSFWNMFKRFFKREDAADIESVILAAGNEGEVRKEEVAIVLKVLRLSRKQVHEIMIPRTDIVCAEIEDRVEDIVDIIITHGHSRIPVYKDNKDNIVGIIHAKDLLRLALKRSKECSAAEPPAEQSVENILRPPLFIPDTKNVMEMLLEFQSSKNHLAIALDEYGGTSGMLTLEDVLEEIVGDIEDEYDFPQPDDIQVQPDGALLLSGRAELEELQDYLHVKLDNDQVDTIGGYLSQLAGRVPRKGDIFDLHGHRFTIQEADQKKVRWIKVRPPAPAPTEESQKS